MQLIIVEDGAVRFKANAIVQHMLEEGTKHGLFDLKTLLSVEMGWTDDDRAQLAQLIGYTVAAYGKLDYVSNELREDVIIAYMASLERPRKDDK